ncbi:MAG: AAA-like domain-containing protein [Clostridium sp.]
MNKRFNTTGVCVHRKHYMVDISNKLKEIKELIDNEFYFTINKPRQYGKTTTLSELNDLLKNEYLVINISFEGIGDTVFENEREFSNKFLKIMSKSLKFRDKEESDRLSNLSKNVSDFEETSEVITEFIDGAKKEVVLFIDEVDKSSNNQLFLSFIGMLRNKYLEREVGRDYTFKSVILVGVYDVKTLKLKLREPEQSKYNTPWNIAIDFNVDMSFSEKEISTMIEEYSEINNIAMDKECISGEIYFFSEGYPFLVSRICQIIDEKINVDNKNPWTKEDVQKAVKIILEEKNTLFDSLIKNLENYEELYKYIEEILIDGIDKSYNTYNPIIELGTIHGYFKNRNGKVDVSNKIFKELIYNYMVSKLENTYSKMDGYNFKGQFLQLNGGLDIEKILKKFQQFMKEQYSSKDAEFIEHHGRLLFLAFIKPIINGVGFDFKEVQVSKEKRLDLVITYNSFKYIIELKIWRGQKYNEEGIIQLCDYLDIHGLDKGYLLIFNFNKKKEFKEERLEIKGKDIFEVFV